jgi:hypothetical protein
VRKGIYGNNVLLLIVPCTPSYDPLYICVKPSTIPTAAVAAMYPACEAPYNISVISPSVTLMPRPPTIDWIQLLSCSSKCFSAETSDESITAFPRRTECCVLSRPEVLNVDMCCLQGVRRKLVKKRKGIRARRRPR